MKEGEGVIGVPQSEIAALYLTDGDIAKMLANLVWQVWLMK